MADKLTLRGFFQHFPNDDACLEHVMKLRYVLRHQCEHCGKEATFHRLRQRPAYSCSNCGHHIYPCAGTIFQDTRTPLQLWFYAIFLFVTTRHGVSGMELKRQLGVTYKTAWRMGHQIRQLAEKADVKAVLGGHVEADEAYIGGRRPGKRGRGAADKTIVMGLKERGGDLRAYIVPDIRKATLRQIVVGNVARGSTVSTDELASYGLLAGDGYQHGVVKHGAKEYGYYDYRHDAVHHTNHVEAFWRVFKYSVRSTHIHVSQKHLGKYLNEFTFRMNHRSAENRMFDLLIGAL